MKYLFSVILVFFFFNAASAQDSCKGNHNELKHGVQFQVSSLLSLNNFKGYTFAYRYRFTDKSGLRIGFNSSLNKSEYDITDRRDTVSINPPNHYNYYNFKVSAQYLYKLTTYKGFSFLIGGGPFVSFGKNDSYDEYLGYNLLVRKTKQIQKTFGYGLDIVSGIEYQLFTNVILSGEYGLNIMMENTKVDSESTEQTLARDIIYSEKGERDSFSIGGSSVNLGLTIFF